MDKEQTASRFDWIGWLATIPGVPSDWGTAIPLSLHDRHEPVADDPDEWIALKAA